MSKLFESTLDLDQAELFDRIFKTQVETYGVSEIARIADIIGKNKLRKVLDIGTGPGTFLLKLAQDLKDVEFIGIDHNEVFLKKAENLKKERGVENVSFTKAYFDKTFSKDAYDMIFARFVFQHASEPQEFVNEVYKRLNSGGFFLTIDEFLFDDGLEEPIWRKFMECWEECFRIAGPNPHLLRTEHSWLWKAGFKDIQSSIHVYSPITIGGENFKELIVTITAALYKMFPDAWKGFHLGELESWLDEVIKTNRVDPFIPMAHVLARKT